MAGPIHQLDAGNKAAPDDRGTLRVLRKSAPDASVVWLRPDDGSSIWIAEREFWTQYDADHGIVVRTEPWE
ncbi:MAG: hypothetical protein U1F48_14440 [Burkholderiales bacterium]